MADCNIKVENISGKGRIKVEKMKMKIFNFLSNLQNLVSKISIFSDHENMKIYIFF